MHEATKHTPYELVFGQPPQSLVIPDKTLVGKIHEEDLGEVCAHYNCKDDMSV